MFIAFEGIDGSGKTTQSKLLAKKLNYFWTYEPTDGIVGNLIRQILKGKYKVDSKTLTLLFAADRFEHNKIIRKNLKRGVVCDRYIFSSLAYQGLDVDEEYILNINKGIIMPDITILLVVDIDIALKRLKSSDIFEKRDFLEKIQKKYLELSKRYNFIVIDTTDKDVYETHKEILKKVKACL